MFKVRDTLCAFDNVTRWNKEKSLFNCSSTTNVYHCIVDERNRSGEICIQAVWVQKGYCPEYNNDANTVDTVPCEWSYGCPNGAFQSNDVYRYPVCLNKTYYDNTSIYDDGPSSIPWIIIAPSVAVGVIVLLLVVTLLSLKRRRRKTTKGNYERIPLQQKEIPFYKTSIFHKANDFIKGGGKIVCLIGQCGSGKSTTAKQVYMSLTGRTPIVKEDLLKFEMSSCEESVIVEEPLPREDISCAEKKYLIGKVITLCKEIEETDNKFLIITSTAEAWKTIADKIYNCLSRKNEFQTLGLDWKNLTKVDRIQILHSIFEYYNPDIPFSRVEKSALKKKAQSLGFPEICALFSRFKEFQKSGNIFFNRPLRYLSLYLEKMCKTFDWEEKREEREKREEKETKEIKGKREKKMEKEKIEDEKKEEEKEKKEKKGKKEEREEKEKRGEKIEGKEKKREKVENEGKETKREKEKRDEKEIKGDKKKREEKGNQGEKREKEKSEEKIEEKEKRKEKEKMEEEKAIEDEKKREQFLLLVYMSVNDMKIDLNKPNEKLWEIFRSFGINTDPMHLKSIIPREFVVEQESSVYVLQHEIIRRITLITFGKLHFSYLLKFSSRKDLVGWIKYKKKKLVEWLFEGPQETSEIEPFLEINDEKWAEYQKKIELTT